MFVKIRNEMDKNMKEILGLKLMYDMDPNCLRVDECRLQKLLAMKKNSEAEETKVLYQNFYQIPFVLPKSKLFY